MKFTIPKNILCLHTYWSDSRLVCFTTWMRRLRFKPQKHIVFFGIILCVVMSVYVDIGFTHSKSNQWSHFCQANNIWIACYQRHVYMYIYICLTWIIFKCEAPAPSPPLPPSSLIYKIIQNYGNSPLFPTTLNMIIMELFQTDSHMLNVNLWNNAQCTLTNLLLDDRPNANISLIISWTILLILNSFLPVVSAMF